ncbi:MAG: Ig-like domain-containing protein [Bacteroidota bacterium]
MEETIHSRSAHALHTRYAVRRFYAVAILIFFISVLPLSDLLACNSPTTSFPINEDFETNSIVNWTQDSADDFNWITNSGGTTSNNTGPTAAYNGTYYAYTEATSPNNPDKVANLISPCFSVQAGFSTELSFAYHMYGDGMGDFNVDISTNDGSSWTNLWGLSGDQGNAWSTQTIDLSTYAGQDVLVRFNVITGNFRSDVSIDDVVISSTQNLTCDPGHLTVERWLGISGSSVSDLTSNSNYPDTPSESENITSFQGPNSYAENYGTRVRGYIIPSETGSYIFNVTGDDNTILYLSTDGQESNKTEIASVTGWSGITDHTKYTQQTSSTLNLTAGVSYYVELLHKEGGGGDHFQVYWQTPSSSTWTIIPGVNLAPFGCPEICGDGIDNDGNGDIDGTDSVCEEHWLEAECATIGANWNTIADATASNGFHLTIQSGNNSLGSPPTGVDDRIRFDVNITTAGIYNIFARVQAPSTGDDSFWVRVNEGTWYRWNELSSFASSSWEWGQVWDWDNSNTPLSFNLITGANTIDFAYREDGTLLDKIVVTTASIPPSGEGNTAGNCSEICDNGIDDDGDMLVDCADPDCLSFSYDGGTISGDEIYCTSFTPGTILSYTDPSYSGGAYTTQWQQSSDNVNWNDIPGETGLTYLPGTVAATTYFRRVTNVGDCLPEIYSNVVIKEIDGSLPICIEDESFEFDCEVGYKISPTGIGIQGLSNAALRVLNPTFMDYYIVEAAFSGGTNATEHVIFSTLEGEQKVVNKQYFEGESGTSGDRYFRTILPASDSIFLSHNGDNALAESFAVYTVAPMDNFSSTSKGYESFGQSVHAELLPGEDYRVSFPLISTINHKEAFINVNLASIVNDGTELFIEATGGGVTLIDTITEPNEGNTLNLEFINLEEIAPDADSLHITISSPSSSGQTALISGYVAAIVECDQNIVIVGETDAECVSVGDTIIYNYQVYNFADVEFLNLSTSSSLGGTIEFGIDTLPPNSNYSASQEVVITQAMIDNPPLVNSISALGWNFTFGIKPFNDALGDTLTICEICDDGVDNDGDGLTDCLDPDCDEDVTILNPDLIVCVGETVQLQSTDSGVGSWVSSNSSVAIVSTDGLAVGVAPGQATFTYTSSSGCTGVTGTFTVDQTLDVTIDYNGSICITADSQLSAIASNGTPGYAYNWTGPNGFTASGQTIDILENGNYDVTVTDSKGCSTNTTAFIYEQYDPFIFTLNSEVCDGEEVTLSINDSDGVAYQWGPNAGNDTSSSVTVIPSAPATTYFVTVTNSIGCSTTASAVIDVIPKPIVDVTGSDEICIGGTTQLSPSSDGIWISADYSIANVSNTGLVTGTGLGSVSFIYKEDSTGCDSDPTEIVSVIDNNTPVISGNDNICFGETSTLISSVSGGTWFSDNNAIATVDASTGEITPITQGTVTISYIPPSEGCYLNAFYTVNTHNNLVLSLNGPSSICEGSLTYVSANTSGTWTSSDESVATISNSGEITAVGAGTVTLSFLSSAGCTEVMATPVTVIANPVVSLTGPGDLCINETTILSPSSGGVWISSNSGVASVNSSGVVTAKSPGTASFTFIETSHGCISENNVSVNVNSRPTISSPSSNSLCIGETANITPASGGIWQSSNSSIASITNDGTITAISQGTVSFTFTNSLTGCTSNASSPLTVQPSPTTTFTGPSSICQNETTTILPNSGGFWSSSDVTIATITNQGIITGLSPGTVRFIFTNGNSGCVSDSSDVLTIIEPNDVIVTGPSNICIGETSALSPGTGGQWTSSNIGIATVTNSGIVTAVSPGSVTFTYQNSNGCSSDPTEAIVVEAAPTLTYLGSTSICIGESTTLSPSTGGQWTSNNTSIATITNEGVVTALAAGSVSFTFTNNATGCSASILSDLTVNTPPTINVTGDDEICIGETTTLQPSTGGAWISGNNSIASVMTNGTVTGLSAGVVTFTFIESATGCTSAASAPITVVPAPVVSIDGANTVCAGTTTTLSPSTGGTWSSDNEAVATVTNSGIVTGISQGVARFTFTNTEGCSSNQTAPVIVFDSPSTLIDGPNALCLGETAQMQPSTGGVWQSSNPSIATINNSGLVSAIMPGTVTFTYTDGSTGCISNPSDPITVENNPVINLTGPSEICIGETTHMIPSIGGIWTSLNTSVATIQNDGEIIGIGGGQARFIFLNLATGCVSDTSAAITVLSGPSISFNGPTNLCLGDTSYILPLTGGTWESSNPAVASVTNTGMIIALGPGTATFQFTESSSGCKSDWSEALTVNGPPTVGITGPSAICISATTNLLPSSGGVWTSLNPGIASVDMNGVVTGLTEGTAYFQFMDNETGCVSDGSLSIEVQPTPEIEITGSNVICLGYTTTLSPGISGIWTSSNPAIASVSNLGVVTGLAPGVVSFQFMDPITGCTSNGWSDPVSVTNCTNHDFNVTLVNEVVYGDLSTNDNVSSTVYGGAIETLSKPTASFPQLTVNADGTYSFQANRAGKYLFKVPVCIAPILVGCEGTLLEINVADDVLVVMNPIANLEFTTTYKGALSTDSGETVEIDALANDTCIYAGSCLLDASSLTILGTPENGNASVSNGKIEYTPDANFVGLDTIDYSVCHSNGITCSQSQEIVIVNDTSALNSTVANDDFYYLLRGSSVSGNVMRNDMDPEGDGISVTAVGSSSSPAVIPEGEYYITNTGEFSFTPNADFFGTLNIVYTICDDNTESFCTNATIHLLVLNDMSIRLRVYLEGALINNGGEETQAGIPLMRDDLRVSPYTGENYIPLTDPYTYDHDPFIDTENKFVKMGPGMLSNNLTIADSLKVFSVSGENAIVDWVHVEIRSKEDSTQIMATRSGLVQRDGDVVDLDGVSNLRFQNVQVDSFYVVVKHRSHLGVMSELITSDDIIDFTDPNFPVFNFGNTYGNGLDYTGLSRKNSVAFGFSALWAGDFDSNGKVKFTNPGDDQNILYLGVLLSSPDFLINYNNAYGYFTGDFNMDGKAKFTNPGDDLNFLFSQILLYPLNTSFLSNFSALIEQVPDPE